MKKRKSARTLESVLRWAMESFLMTACIAASALVTLAVGR